jgi:hypothetical protein
MTLQDYYPAAYYHHPHRPYGAHWMDVTTQEDKAKGLRAFIWTSMRPVPVQPEPHDCARCGCPPTPPPSRLSRLLRRLGLLASDAESDRLSRMDALLDAAERARKKGE